MCCAFSSRTCPDAFGASAESASAMTMPCCTSRLAIVRMSARSGRLASTSGSAVNRLAAISGNAAFLAPPIGIAPASGAPPRIRILSITAAPGTGCFYGRERQRSSRRLVRAWIRGGFGGAPLLGASLLLAPVQIFAQSPGETLVALGVLFALGKGQTGGHWRRIGHRPDGTGALRPCQ